ncbi:MAG: N-acetylneuraminate epimerase [Pedosphaera sp.]|nr:N-acetylneuraminate epimerase [Pedosphaera sp.]
MNQQVHLRFYCNIVALLSVLVCMPVNQARSDSAKLDWKQLPSIPDRHGFAGAFSGVSHGALIVAGGANFPDAMPWEGGQKVWHDSIFILPGIGGHWLTGFKLPHPLGYGISVTTSSGVLCCGGSDAQQHFADVFLLTWRDGKIETKKFPPLPQPLANGCGAVVGNVLYIAGGIDTSFATNALNNFWSLDLSKANAGWRQLDPWPGPPRMLSVAGTLHGNFYLFSGVSLKGDAAGKPVRQYLTDAYCFVPGHGWKRIADLPRAAVAAPSPAADFGDQLLIVSGDDGRLVNFEPKSAHPGFPRTVLYYESRADNGLSLAILRYRGRLRRWPYGIRWL